MTVITNTVDLARFCKSAAAFPYVTIDTEFIREKTYWPRLCLVQIATQDEVAAIDTLASGIELTPLFELLANTNVLKVFHAARQDVEIFVHLTGEVPTPIFDTQVAAMACGYGDSVAYERLVRDIAKKSIDKTMRFTDWAKRPLAKQQIDYAIGDVTHLRKIYEQLEERLEETNRGEWLAEEVEILTDTATYLIRPEDAWRRLKVRSRKPRYFANIKALADWRETLAQHNDIPRSRVLKDESLTEICAHGPKSANDLLKLRAVKRDRVSNDRAHAIIGVLNGVRAMESHELPEAPPEPLGKSNNGPSIELLKVLLRLKCDMHQVAQKLVASSADLEAIAADDYANVRALSGWRRDLFGEDALRLKRGELALTADGPQIKVIEIKDPTPLQ